MLQKTVFGKNTWIPVNVDSQSSIDEKMEFDLSINEEITAYTTDMNELAHMEYDIKQQRLILVYDVIHNKKTDGVYGTSPMTFIVTPFRLITLYTTENAYMVEQISHLLDNEDSVYDFVFKVINAISKHYFKVIELLTKELTKLNHQIREKTTKKRLLALSDIELSMIAIRSSSKQNFSVLEQMRDYSIGRALSSNETELLLDAIIEARQILEMSDLNVQTMGQLSETFNNVLNNQLNDTMKILTVLSILLATPDIITGFFGINVPLPHFMVSSSIGWVMVIGIIVVFWFVMAKVLSYILDLDL